MLLICVGFCWRGLGFVYCYHNTYNRWALEMPTAILGGCAMSLFACIYESTLKKYIIAFGGLIFFTHLAYQLYFTFIKPVDPSIPLRSITGLSTSIQFFKVVYTSLILLISIRFIIKILKKYGPDNLYFLRLRKWAFSIFIILILNWACIITNQYSTADPDSMFFLLVLLLNYATLLLLLFRPRFLNRSNFKLKPGVLFEKKAEVQLSKQVFVDAFFVNVFYLDKEASVEKFKKQLNLSSGTLNDFLFEHYGMSFTDLINKHRINYFMDLVNTGRYHAYTIDAMAQEAGFSSRFHLYKAFKKFHGGSPSDYIRSIAT